MEMKQNRNWGRTAHTREGHNIFFPHGFVDPLTGRKMSRFVVDEAHFETLSRDAKEAGVPIRRYVCKLLKEGSTPFASEASRYIASAGKKEYATVDMGVAYLIRLAERADIREKAEKLTFEGWIERFALRDEVIKEALKDAFKGEVSQVAFNPAFEADNALLRFSEFIEFLTYRFLVKGQNQIALGFILKDGEARLNKVE